MKSSFEFAQGLDTLFDGIMIHIKENSERNMDMKEKTDPPRHHLISGTLRDEIYNQLNSEKIDYCKLAFEDQTLYFHVKERQITVSFKDQNTGRESLKPCMQFMVPEGYFTEDHDVYIFFSSDSGPKLPNQHVIHNVRFYDIKHLHDSED